MAASATQPREVAQSFTEVRVGDVEAVGAHCQLEYCHKLDFLPFKCESCKGTYCLDHRSETAHKCPKEGDWARRRNATLNYPSAALNKGPPDERVCENPSCKITTSLLLTTAVQCARCNRQYCLKHRMEEDHNCKNLVPRGARPSNSTAVSALSKLKAWAAEQRKLKEQRDAKKTKGMFGLGKSPSPAQALQNEINVLKRTAKGDASVPQEKRVYLKVEASADTTKAKFPTGTFFYNKEWTVGRVLDMAAKALQVQNVNNRGGGEEEKLRVFHVEGGRLLKFTEKIGDPCSHGNMIVLLRGVGSGEPDLIDL